MAFTTNSEGVVRKPVVVFLLVLLAILLPPLAVLLDQGCGEDFLINILLTILGWIPGIIHAIYILAVRAPKPVLEPTAGAAMTTTTSTTNDAATPVAAAPAGSAVTKETTTTTTQPVVSA